MTYTKLFIIVNARAGEEKIRTLRQTLASIRPIESYSIHLTEYGGHAGVLANEAVRQGAPVVVAMGGDGTVNEVIQALANAETALAIIPAGSGNGLARHCDIPLQADQAISLIDQAKTISIDLGKINDTFFISNAGVGFDATVCQAIRQTKSRGLKMYIRHVIRHFFSYQPHTYTIDADGNSFTEKAFFLNVANGREFGYGFQIAPGAALQDGLLDLILVRRINFLNGFRFVWDGWRKKLGQNKNCIYIRARKIRIQSNQMDCFQADGDAHDCNNSCTIDIHPSALRILVPKHITTV